MNRLRRDLVTSSIGALVALVSIGAGTLTLRNTGIEFPDETIQTTAAPENLRRGFYVPNTTFTGASALSGCATGYHLASIYEIVDPAHLQYDEDAPNALPGPATGFGDIGGSGWVRTGTESERQRVIGSNCSNWTSNSSVDWGTYANPDLGQGGGVHFGAWKVSAQLCDLPRHVMCVED